MRLIPSLILACLVPTFGMAQDYVLPDQLATMAARQPEQLRRQMIQQLLKMSPDGALSEEQAQVHLERNAAQIRESQMRVWRMNDLDGDGSISKDEVSRLLLVLGKIEKPRFEAQVKAADTNADGSVSEREIKAAVAAQTTHKNAGKTILTISMLQSLDFNQDGTTTIDDIVSAVASLPNTSAGAALALESSGCTLPEPSAISEIVLFGAYQGQSVSTVAVAGLDTETSSRATHHFTS